MFSKSLELAGLSLIALAVGMLLGLAAGLIVAGFALLLVGSTTDDAQVTLAMRRGMVRAKRAYGRQAARETARSSPHPPIHVDPETDRVAQLMAAQRVRRGDGRMREATP